MCRSQEGSGVFPESLRVALAFSCLDSALIGRNLTTLKINLSLSWDVIVEGKVEINASATIDFLPHTGPRVCPPSAGANCAFTPRQPGCDCRAVVLAFTLALA